MIETENSSITYIADGAQTQWSYPYRYNNPADLKLYVTLDGVRTEIAATDFYIDTATGEITYPLSGDPVAAGGLIEICRETAITQLESSALNSFKSDDIERMADKLTMAAQDLKREMADIVAPEGGAIAETIAAAVQTSIANHNASTTAHTDNLVAKTGSTMTGDLTMAKNGTTVSGVRFLDENDTGYRMVSTRDTSNNKQLQLFDITAGNGIFLNSADANRPYYYNGTDTSSKLLLPSDIASKANTALDNLTETGEAHFANPSLSNVNATGTSAVAGWAMPSSTYDDLTLPASNTDVTAPSNGWFVLKKLTSGNNQEIRLTNNTNGLVGYGYAANSGSAISAAVLCQKGDEVNIYYSAGGTTQVYRFIYAEGSKSEAN